MIVKIINSILILVAVFMGLKQGWAMLSANPKMTDMFAGWEVGKTGMMIIGAFTLLSAVMIIFAKTFVWENFLMAAGILLICCFHLLHRDLKGVAVEIPFLLLNFVIIYLQHPLSRNH